MFRKIVTLMAAALLGSFALVAVTASPAAASGCTIYNNVDVGTYDSASGYYHVRGDFTKPAPGCYDIQFKDCVDGASGTSGDCYMWIRIHHADGTLTWDYVINVYENDPNTWKIIWYNVPTGTKFQVWGSTCPACGNFRVDMMD
jgi:hypothetical protein